MARGGQKEILKAHLTAEDICAAENSIISFVQRREFPSLFNKDDNLRSSPRSLQKLRPFLENGILRVGGRLSRATIHYDAKHPIIIPKGVVAQLLISDYQQRHGHVGTSHTWSLLRGRFWIKAGGSEVRRVIGRCIQCCKRKARPCQQLMADLPPCRVTANEPPFSSVGVDYFGPLTVKQGRSSPKRYGCIFTCMASRAIHLEVAIDLSITSFLNAFRRFMSRRGTPSVVYSDNETNFVGADREIKNLHEQLQGQKLQNYMAMHKIVWKFNSPRAPHMGGVWERMVGLVKTILKGILQNQLVTDDTLHTLLLEVEHIANSSPLIPVTMDPTGDEPLTPNHLLILRSAANCFENNTYQKADNYASRRWKQVQYLAQQFWRRWSTEYLPLLQQRVKWTKQCSNLTVGDLVIMVSNRCQKEDGPWQQ